jgi:MraZ protein
VVEIPTSWVPQGAKAHERRREQKPLGHPLLIGEHELSIDEKSRLPIPAAVRKNLDPERDGNAFYLVLGLNRKPWLYPEKYYEQIVSQAQNDLMPGQEQLDYDHMNYALADKIAWDAQGRLQIPVKTLRRSGLDREVTVIGARDHLEIWNKQDWEARREELLARSAEVVIRAKQARQSPPPPASGQG